MFQQGYLDGSAGDAERSAVNADGTFCSASGNDLARDWMINFEVIKLVSVKREFNFAFSFLTGCLFSFPNLAHKIFDYN